MIIKFDIWGKFLVHKKMFSGEKFKKKKKKKEKDFVTLLEKIV